MATKKFLEIQEFSDVELQNELNETEVQFNKLKFDHAVKGLDNPMILRDIRRDVARLNTEIRRRHMNAAREAGNLKNSKKVRRRKK